VGVGAVTLIGMFVLTWGRVVGRALRRRKKGGELSYKGLGLGPYILGRGFQGTLLFKPGQDGNYTTRNFMVYHVCQVINKENERKGGNEVSRTGGSLMCEMPRKD